MFTRMRNLAMGSLLLCYASSALAGIVVGGTRVIFTSDNPDATISIYNKEVKLPYLIQVWVDPFNKDDNSKPPFAAIPPVSRLEPGQEKILRIIKTAGGLPEDRESVFWRPVAIRLIPEKAIDKVKWHRQGHQLVVENMNPIHINIMDVVVDGKDVPLNMIRPFETLTLALPAGSAGHSLVWRFINDYGAVSQPVKQTL